MAQINLKEYDVKNLNIVQQMLDIVFKNYIGHEFPYNIHNFEISPFQDKISSETKRYIIHSENKNSDMFANVYLSNNGILTFVFDEPLSLVDKYGFSYTVEGELYIIPTYLRKSDQFIITPSGMFILKYLDKNKITHLNLKFKEFGTYMLYAYHTDDEGNYFNIDGMTSVRLETDVNYNILGIVGYSDGNIPDDVKERDRKIIDFAKDKNYEFDQHGNLLFLSDEDKMFLDMKCGR